LLWVSWFVRFCPIFWLRFGNVLFFGVRFWVFGQGYI